MADDPALIKRIVIQNYKSIRYCDVRLGPLSILVGRNGSGKSNFLDALHFVSSALRTTLEQAFDERGGVAEVLYRGVPHARLGITLEITLPGGIEARYSFRIGSLPYGGVVVDSEEGMLRDGIYPPHFSVQSGVLDFAGTLPENIVPRVPLTRLSLGALSGLGYYQPLYDALAGMTFYHFDVRAMRQMQPRVSESMALDGGNIASVLQRLREQKPWVVDRITSYMSTILPGLDAIDGRTWGPVVGLEFVQRLGPSGNPASFHAGNMSEGTLQALGVLVALFQSSGTATSGGRVIGIEEPETALHPAATAALRDALVEASSLEQVIVTTQSADLLDSDDLPPESILAVTWEDGETRIGPLGERDRSIIRDHLATAGELLRSSDFQPEIGELTAPTIHA